MDFKDNLIREMDAAGVNQSELARALKISPSAVNQWRQGITEPGRKRVREVAAALGISVNALIPEERFETPIRQKINKASIVSRRASSTGAPDGMRADTPTLPDPDALARDVQIFGTILQGGVPVLNFRDGPASVALRQPGLIGRQHVFGFYVPDAAMAPWREVGEIVFVQRGRPAVVGGYTVALLEGDGEGDPPIIIGRLAVREAGRVALTQLNPPHTVEIEADRVRELLYVLSQAEVLGL